LEGDREEGITDEEIETQIRKMKKRRRQGQMEIENKAWLYSGGRMGKAKRIIKSVERRGFPGRMEGVNNFPHTQKRSVNRGHKL